MDKQLLVFIAMSFPKRFIQLRKEHKLTQQEMADQVGIHITQVKRYEAGRAQPSVVSRALSYYWLTHCGELICKQLNKTHSTRSSNYPTMPIRKK